MESSSSVFGAVPGDFGEPLLLHFSALNNELFADVNGETTPMARVVSVVGKRNLQSCRHLRLFVDEEGDKFLKQITLAIQKTLFYVRLHAPEILKLELGFQRLDMASMIIASLKDTFRQVIDLAISYSPWKKSPRFSERESPAVIELLEQWVAKDLRSSLRSLRIFPFVKVDVKLQRALAQCINLRHLTLSKLHSVRDNPVFKGILSVEFDGCDLAMQDEDLRFARLVLKMFPDASTFNIHRVPHDVFSTALTSLLVQSQREFTMVVPWRDALTILEKLQVQIVIVFNESRNEVEAETVHGSKFRFLCSDASRSLATC